MSLPSLPLFPGAYFGDTKHLSCEEHGAYLQLLMIAWQAGGAIPDDDAKIARMVSLSLKRWLSIKPTVMAFWTRNEEGAWVQSRLLKELSWVNSRIEKRRDAGKLGGRPKSLKNKEPSQANGSAPESKTKAPTPTPTPTEEEAASAASARARPPPDESTAGLRAEIVQAFHEVGSPSIPDTSRAAVWLAKGYRREVIVPVIREVLARKPAVATMAYFDGPLADAHANPPPPRPLNGASNHGTHRKPTVSDVLRRKLAELGPDDEQPPQLAIGRH